MGPFIFLDIETTGINPSCDRIIEIACVRYKDGGISERFESLINPGVPIPQEISLLTGIKDSDVKDAPRFSEIKEKLFCIIGDLPIIGHNIAFDSSFLRCHHVEFKNPEIDTVSLARILLPKETSYALEVLIQKYCPASRKSHRAMADTENTVMFFEFLLGKITKIPKKTFGKMRKILERTDWVGKEAMIGDGLGDTIRGIPPNLAGMEAQHAAPNKTKDKTPLPVFTTDAAHQSLTASRSRAATTSRATTTSRAVSRSHTVSREKRAKTPAKTTFWSNQLISDFSNNSRILLQSPFDIPLSRFKNQPFATAYSSVRKRDEIISRAERENLSVVNIKEPFFYLSPKKLAERSEQSNISAEEIPFLLKLTLWGDATETGDREELSFDRFEYGMFEPYADTDSCDVFWQKILEKAKKANIVLVHHAAIAKGFLKSLNLANCNLIILEASSLEDNFTFALREKITQNTLHPHFGEKAAIISGLIGIFYEHFTDLNTTGFTSNVVLDDAKRNSLQWKRVIDAINNLPDVRKKQQLLDVTAPKENHIQWVSVFAEEVSFYSAPVDLTEIFRQNVSGFDKILLHGDALGGDGSFNLIREIFELDSTWHSFSENNEPWFGNLQIELAKNMPNPNTEGHFRACVKLFTRIIEEKRGKSLFILNSKKTVESLYSVLLPLAKKLDVQIFGVGPSGGIGKSLALFLNNPETSILLSTSQVLAYFDEIEDQIDVIAFQKIPFDPPDNPILQARGNKFNNAFEEYSLQRAVIKFREILIEFGKSERQKICYLLDNRLLSRDYGRMFI